MPPIAHYFGPILTPGLLHFADRLGRWAYRATGGRWGSRQLGMPVLLLTTTGRKSGAPRTHTLQYVRDGQDLVVIASNIGQPQHPAWYLNLLAHPQVVVELAGRRRAMVAVPAEGATRARLWQAALAIWPRYAEYEARTTRVIPVVILRAAAHAE